MKKLLLILSILIILISCSKKEEISFQAFSPEAFAYDIGDGWEVNSTVRVKGFQQEQNSQKKFYSVSISYSVNLITPNDSLIENVFEDTFHKSDSEKMMDVQLEAQFDLDTSFSGGVYKIDFRIKDNNSQDSTSIQTDFKLEE